MRSTHLAHEPIDNSGRKGPASCVTEREREGKQKCAHMRHGSTCAMHSKRVAGKTVRKRPRRMRWRCDGPTFERERCEECSGVVNMCSHVTGVAGRQLQDDRRGKEHECHRSVGNTNASWVETLD